MRIEYIVFRDHSLPFSLRNEEIVQHKEDQRKGIKDDKNQTNKEQTE